MRYREVIFFSDYFDKFYSKQRPKVQRKISLVIDAIETIEHVPETYLKFLTGTDGLYEVRVQMGSDIFRIFCFFDKGKLIVLINGFQKKTQKTPSKEIEKALKIKEEYFESKLK